MTFAKTLRALGLVLGVVLVVTSVGHAQVSTSSVSGTVTDKTGAVVAGAKVVAKNEATGLTYQTTTTGAGDYLISGLSPGKYTITVTMQGFRTFSSVRNDLTVGAPVVVDATLEVGEMSQVVQVESSYAKIETTSAALGGVVTRREVVELPLNGRNPLNLIILEPGLVQRTTNAAGSGTHVFGSRDRAHNVTIDGIDANESSVPNPQSNLLGLTPDNVQEYRVVTHAATPEYGRNSGANVTIATRSGTNDFHGDVFYFHRNTALNANEFFNSAKGQAKPVLRLHQWGADVGGPIFKNRTFFFGSYQGNRIQQTLPIAGIFGIPRVYTTTAKQGVFRFVRGTITVGGQKFTQNSSQLVDSKTGDLLPGATPCGGSVTTNCVDSYNIFDPLNDTKGVAADTAVGGVIGKFPAPNDFTIGDGLNIAGFNWNPPSQFKGPFWMGRLDHKFDDNNNIFVRFNSRDYNTTQGDFLNSRPQVFPGYPPLGEVFRIGRNAAISYRHVFNPKMVNEFTTGYSYFKFSFTFGESNPDLNDPAKDPPWAQDCIIASFQVDTPFCNSPHTQRGVSTVQYIDNLSIIQGSHTFKTGINFRFYRHNDSRGLAGGRNTNPEIAFSGSSRDPAGLGWTLPSGIDQATDLGVLKQTIVELGGIPSLLQRTFSGYIGLNTFPGGLQVTGIREKQFDTYFQDEWKLTRTLTMTYGVRWEWNLPPTDCCGRTIVPDKPIDGSQGTVTYVKSDKWYQRQNANALAPSLALAWNPRNGKTVIRTGYRMAFDTLSTFQITSISGQVPGAVLQCRFNLSNSGTSSALTIGTTGTGCVQPSGLDKTISTGFPLTMTSPTSKPSDSFTPLPKTLDNALAGSAFDQNLKIPTVHEWDLTIQRELPGGFTVEVGYIGKHGTHLYRAYDLSQLSISQSGFLDSFLIARNNLGNGCNADGTGTPKPGTTCASPTLLLSLATATFLKNSTVATQLRRNGIGDLIRRMDSSTNGSWKVTCTGTPSPSAPCFPSNYARPNPQFGSIFFFDSGGSSTYHGGIVRLRRRFEKGLTMGLSYTYAKAIDDMSVDPVGASSGGGLSSTNSRTPTDVHNFRLDRSRADFDNRHVLVANFLYELPFGRGRQWGSGLPGALDQVFGGWTLTGIYTFQSGEPFTINSNSRTGNGGQKVGRAELVGLPPNTDLKPSTSSSVIGPVLFNPTPGFIADPRDPRFASCKRITDSVNTLFCFPAAGTFGMGRNTIQGPGNWNFDFGVLKNFRLTERWRFQFRAEFFNVFNHPNFENPRNASEGSPTLTSGQFGTTCCVTASLPSSATIIALGEPNRVIQFSGKISF